MTETGRNPTRRHHAWLPPSGEMFSDLQEIRCADIMYQLFKRFQFPNKHTQLLKSVFEKILKTKVEDNFS